MHKLLLNLCCFPRTEKENLDLQEASSYNIQKKEAAKMERLKEIYGKYVQTVAKVYKDAKPMDGLFGWGDDPRKDPCHMRFYEDAEAWVTEFAASGPDREAAYAVVSFLLRTPQAYREKHCFWFMFAAQGLSRELIGLLDAGQCAELRTFYDEAYPKRERMPVQKEVYKLLKKGAK